MSLLHTTTATPPQGHPPPTVREIVPPFAVRYIVPPSLFLPGGTISRGRVGKSKKKRLVFFRVFFAHQISTFDVDFSWWRIVRMCSFLFISFFFLISFFFFCWLMFDFLKRCAVPGALKGHLLHTTLKRKLNTVPPTFSIFYSGEGWSRATLHRQVESVCFTTTSPFCLYCLYCWRFLFCAFFFCTTKNRTHPTK